MKTSNLALPNTPPAVWTNESRSIDPSSAFERAPIATPVNEHLNLVVVGHVDHGKSTLIGRLLFDTNSVPTGQAERIRAACRAEGMEFEYAFLLDALLEEQAQNVTLDTTRVPFRHGRREYTIIDAPGHEEFLKHMITGAASADAAVLIIDAKAGVAEQSRRHSQLLALLGIKQVAVAVNKMDLVDYSEPRFEVVRREVEPLLSQLGLQPTNFVPIAAKFGDGLATRGPHMPWYHGPTLLKVLEQMVRVAHREADGPLRVAVQDVYRFDHRRIVAGLVVSGNLAVGAEVEFLPGGKHGRVKSIENWPGPADETTPRPSSVTAERVVAFTLEQDLFIERGQICVSSWDKPRVTGDFSARVFWLHSEPLRVGDILPLRLATQAVETRIASVARVFDSKTLGFVHSSANEVRRHEIAEIQLRTRRPLVADLYQAPALRRFVLVRGRRIAGGGIIDEAQPWQPRQIDNLTVTAAERFSLLGHRGAVIWMTGLSGAGKSTLAVALEKELFRHGILAAILDGDVLRAGICHGLGFSDEERRENIRRASEAALLLAEAGVVAVTALISPFRRDRADSANRCRIRGIPFAEVFVNAPLAECERRDPKKLSRRARAGEIKSFTGIDSPYEAPIAPALEIQTDRETIEESTDRLASFTLELARQRVCEHADAAGEI